MKPPDPLSPPDARAVCCDVAGHGTVRATPAELPALRQRPGPDVGVALPTSFLKHADDQTVAGVAAVFQAIHDYQLDLSAFTGWGVVAGPRFLGRATLTTALQRFAAEGAWGISPHLIPHRSLHAVSGTISQALQMHGPNFGVGGGPGAEQEALLTGAALLSANQLPGVWVILTGWDPEPEPDRKGQVPASCVCQGLALALMLPHPTKTGCRLRVLPRPERQAAGARSREPDSFTIAGLASCLESGVQIPATVVWSLAMGGRIELELAGTGGNVHRGHGLPIGAGTEKRQ